MSKQETYKVTNTNVKGLMGSNLTRAQAEHLVKANIEGAKRSGKGGGGNASLQTGWHIAPMTDADRDVIATNFANTLRAFSK